MQNVASFNKLRIYSVYHTTWGKKNKKRRQSAFFVVLVLKQSIIKFIGFLPIIFFRQKPCTYCRPCWTTIAYVAIGNAIFIATIERLSIAILIFDTFFIIVYLHVYLLCSENKDVLRTCKQFLLTSMITRRTGSSPECVSNKCLHI